MRFFSGFLLACLGAAAMADAPPLLGKQAPDFALIDYRGRQYQLSRTDAQVVVLYFTATGCPIARQGVRDIRRLQKENMERGARFWFVDSNTGDDREGIAKEAREFNYGWLPVLIDDSQGVAGLLGVRRTGTAVAIDVAHRQIFYQGAVDDRLVEGAQKPEASHFFLRDALNAFFEGKDIAVPQSEARGCLLSFSPRTVSYTRDVAPILERKCLGCHSSGNIGPIKMTNFRKVHGNADMIQEVLLARRMPPWQADPAVGDFANDHSLAPEESRTLLRWIEEGAQRGEGDDPLENAGAPVKEWSLGQPDTIIPLPKVQEVPATGVLDYRHIKVPAPFDHDVWVKGVTVKPDNRRVVHHIIVRVQEPGKNELHNPDDAFLIGWAPGSPEIFFPEGTGKLIPKGSILDFEMHYTTSGREEKDQSRIGLYLHEDKPAMVLKTQAAYNLDFEVQPGNPSENVAATYVFRKDSFLFDMAPHMHMRGHWFKFEALYPTGEKELLLSVPSYDFNWQYTYRLKEPKRMPAGTWILCTGGFDNSPRKPGNPNPRALLHFGEQSFDEMFIGFMGVAEIPASSGKPLARK